MKIFNRLNNKTPKAGIYYITEENDVELDKEWKELVKEGIITVDRKKILKWVPHNDKGILVVSQDVRELDVNVFHNVSFIGIIILNPNIYLRDETFLGCKYLKGIIVNANQDRLPEGLFSYCENLKKIRIEGNINTVSSKIIINCPNIEELYFGANVKEIECGVISGAHRLSRVSVDDKNIMYSSFNGSNIVVDIKNKCLVLGSYNSTLLDDFDIRFIGPESYKDNVLIKKIDIPKTVKHIQRYAFSGCTSLTEFTVPENIIKLESGVFQNCTNLENVYISNEIKTLKNTGPGSGIFDGCTNLKYVEFKNKKYMNATAGNNNEDDDESDYIWKKIDVSDPYQNALNFISDKTGWNALEFRALD